MAYDVTNFVAYMQRRQGHKKPDKLVRSYMVFTGFCLLLPFKYFKTKVFFESIFSGFLQKLVECKMGDVLCERWSIL